jgi:Uma2 family endonuclease
MGLAAIKQDGKYTYKNYRAWEDGRRWEIIRGQAYDMTPAPVTFHQFILGELYYQLKAQLKEKSCHAFTAPFDVLLPLGEEKTDNIENVVQPDISVVCDPSKLEEKGCLGAPDFIIEILSPATARKDRLEKFNLYEQAGVKEYWIVSPEEKMVQVFILDENNRYGRPSMYEETGSITLTALHNLTIDLIPVFDFTPGTESGET